MHWILKYIFILGCCLTSLVQAEDCWKAFTSHRNPWGPEAHAWNEDLIRDIQKGAFAVGGPFEETVYGLVRIPVLANVKVPTLMLASSYFKFPLQCALDLRKDKQGRTLSAPLMVVLPGLGHSVHSPYAKLGIKNFSSRGFHVLVIPNALAPTYGKALPRFPAHDIVADARVILGIIQKVKGLFPTDTIHLYGESFGGLLVPIVKELDHSRPKPLINGMATMASMPVSFYSGMKELDKIIANNPAVLGRKFEMGLAWLAIKGPFWLFGERKHIGESEDEMQTLVAAGFSKGIELSTALHLRSQGLPVPGSFSLRRPITITAAMSLVMEKELNPFSTDEKEGRYYLNYWLGLLAERGDFNWRAIVDEHDFVNPPGSLDQLTGVDASKHFLRLPAGGHLGYLAWDRTQELFDYAFGPRIW